MMEFTGIVHLTDIEQALRWAVVFLGGLTAISSVLGLYLLPTMRENRALPIFIGFIASGMVLNYLVAVPVVVPGAFFYLAAYLYALGVYSELMFDRYNHVGTPMPNQWFKPWRPESTHGKGTPGRPGEPGEPGEPGDGAGGAGGHGGTGGHGGHGGGGRVHGVAVICACVVVALLSAAVLSNVQKIENQQDQLKATQRQAEKHFAHDAYELRAVALAQCLRVQGLRQELNASNAAGFVAIQASMDVIQSAPGYIRTRAVLSHTVHLRHALDELNYYPPTDCEKAVMNPNYQRPPAISMANLSAARLDQILRADS